MVHIRVLSEPLNDFNDGRCPGSKLQISEFLYTATQKVWGGIILYPPNRLSVHPSVCSSALRFQAPTLVRIPIFFKLCIGIDIGEEWYGIATGLFLFRSNIESWPLIYVKNVFFPNIFRIIG